MTAFSIDHAREFFIGGEWVAPSSSSTIDVVNASDETVVTTIAEAREADVDRAVAVAREAFDHGPWPDLAHAERGRLLRAVAAELDARSDDLARIWAAESGVTYRFAAPRIGPMLRDTFIRYADLAESFPFEESHTPQSGGVGLLVREPVGVVAAIVPWNGPAGLLAYKAAPALLAGCTLVIKMSPEAPCSAHVFAEVFEKVGLPPGVVNILCADREVSEHLVRHPGVDKVTFTGSTETGRQIASICGERIARCTLELGGKSPALVLDDYDLEVAANTIVGGMAYLTGQVCHSLTRVIVSRPRHDEMVEALCAATGRLVVGDAFDPDSDMGPLATARQRERVEGYIERGRAEGARLASGGGRPSGMTRGFFIEPTVFAGVDNSSTIAQEEIFGPVLSVIAAADEDDAVRLANDTVYGLNASVFTGDVDRARAVARRLKSGTVGHNASRTDFSIAFGGYKQSGVGREGGAEGLHPFLECKTVVLDA